MEDIDGNLHSYVMVSEMNASNGEGWGNDKGESKGISCPLDHRGSNGGWARSV